MNSFKIIIIALLLSGGLNISCNKLVEVSPPITSTNAANVYTSDATAISVMTGIYENISSSQFFSGGILSLSLLPGLSADEFQLFGGTTNSQYLAYYMNNLNPGTYGFEFWNDLYPVIFTSNAAIDGLNNGVGLTPAIKQQLLGEAKFIRAFCYFYLVNLYGDVPLVLTSDYKDNSLLARTPKAQVWIQIIADLSDAEHLLSSSYLDATLLNPTLNRVRPTQWAATALLARSYLYNENWTGADSAASAVIANSSLFYLTGLDSVFLANSTEAIWQLQPVFFGQNTEDAVLFILPPSGPSIQINPIYLDSILLNRFEADDQRRVQWIDSVIAGGVIYYFPYKYKVYINPSPVTEYEMVLRLGEQYLIRAEAEANGAPGDAVADLNVIRTRAGLPDYSGPIDKVNLINAILHERQIELFSEWGNRWLDLKRNNSVDSVMNWVTPLKGGVWNPIEQMYPLPLTDIKADPKLIQNSGY